MQLKNLAGSLLMSAAIAALLPASAFADSFTFQFASQDVSGSGTLIATPDGNPGEYVITSLNGTVIDKQFGTFTVGLRPCATPQSTCTDVNSDGHGANLQYDNLLFPGNSTDTQLDGYGIVLTPGPPGSGTNGISISDYTPYEFYGYPDNGDMYGSEPLTTPFQVTPAAAPVTTTPEPTSLALLGTGLAGICFRVRRNRKQ